MTIAKTGNKIVDDLARSRSRAQAEERRVKASAKRAAGKGKKTVARRAVSRSRAANGKVAAGRGGRGIVIKKSASGKSAGGLLRYMSEDPTAKLILSNCGDNLDQQARFMRACSGTNPKVKNWVGHTIVALPPGEKKSVEQWRKIVEHITRELGLDDTYPVVAYLHQTDKGQDLHICYSRVSLSGEVLNDSNDKYLMTSIEQDCENRFSLRVVPRDQMKPAPRLHLGEVRQAERTGLKPAKLVVGDAIKLAKTDRPNPIEFIERLRVAGVVAAPYTHGGEMKGFSFSMDGQSFKGKDVAASWTVLKGELNYEQNRDLASLAILSAEARADTTGIEPTAIPASAIAEPTPSVEPKIQRSGERMEHPASETKKPTTIQKATESVRPNASAPPLNEDDPIVKKMRARAALIEQLRRETGDRRELARELAQRIEHGELYRQREIVKGFIADHKADPKAVAIVKEYMPELAPVASHVRAAEPVQEIPERLRIADQCQEPTPSEQQGGLSIPDHVMRLNQE